MAKKRTPDLVANDGKKASGTQRQVRGSLRVTGTLDMASVGLSVLGLKNLIFPPNARDGTKEVVAAPDAKAISVFGSITSPVSNGFLPIGGLTQGFADLTKTPVEQVAYGPLVVAQERPTNTDACLVTRVSTIGPNGRKDAKLPNGEVLRDLAGIAIGCLALGDYQRIVLVRVEAVSGGNLTLVLRKADVQGPGGEPVFAEDVNLTLVLLG